MQRKEFKAPDIDGYKAYKADLHTHTIFSDGHLSMEARIREAIEAKRTLAYSYGTLAGSEELLRKFFESSISVQHMPADHKGRRNIIITNNSSVDWILRHNGDDVVELGADSSILVRDSSSGDNIFTVLNVWYGEDKHLEYDLFAK